MDRPVSNLRFDADFINKVVGMEQPQGIYERFAFVPSADFDGAPVNFKVVSMKAADYTTENNHFRIVVIDEDNNGRYNDYGVDRFGITSYGQDSVISHIGNNFVTIQPEISVYFTRNKLAFTFEGKDDIVKAKPSQKVVHDIYFPDFLPDISLIDARGDSVNLHHLQRAEKHAFILFRTLV